MRPGSVAFRLLVPLTLDSTLLCPACLASNATGEQCVHCRAPLLLGGHYVARTPMSEQRSARTLAGIDRRDDSEVIIKTLSVSGLSEWKELELFQRGIGVLRGLAHPGVPEHLDDGEITRGGETIYYWVQRRLDGHSLAEGLAQGQRWNEVRARAMAEAILEILEYLQSFSPPIIHRDIKPSNVFERTDGSWALIDFDLVKDTLDPEGGSTTALGTAGYAPLEQLMGKAVPASDLYGLGATLVALLSRKAPSDLLDTDTGRIDFRDHVRISDALATFIERLLDPRVGRRPADARAARALLTGAEPPQVEHESSSIDLDEEPTPTESISALPARDLKLVPVSTDHEPEVRIDLELIERHPAPRWILPARLGAIAATVFMVPAGAMVLAVLGLTTWVVSGFVFRYPVNLPEGRALYLGGLGNTDRPGRHWLRRRWVDVPHSIPTHPLRLTWQPAPTRVDGAGDDPLWLELELELWFTPRADDVGQFSALLKYGGWQSHPHRLGEHLRQGVLPVVVEALGSSSLVQRARRARLGIRDEIGTALDDSFSSLGLTIVAHGEQRATLGPRIDELQVADKIHVERSELPTGARS